MTQNEIENNMNWELELVGMKRNLSGGLCNNGQDANLNFFKTEGEFDETIYKFLNGTRQEYNYNPGRRKINYLKEQGKIL